MEDASELDMSLKAPTIDSPLFNLNGVTKVSAKNWLVVVASVVEANKLVEYPVAEVEVPKATTRDGAKVVPMPWKYPDLPSHTISLLGLV